MRQKKSNLIYYIAGVLILAAIGFVIVHEVPMQVEHVEQEVDFKQFYTVPNYIDNFLDMMVAERGVSVNTIDAYRRDLEQLESQSEKSLDEIEERDISSFISWLNNTKHYAKSKAQTFHFSNNTGGWTQCATKNNGT